MSRSPETISFSPCPEIQRFPSSPIPLSGAPIDRSDEDTSTHHEWMSYGGVVIGKVPDPDEFMRPLPEGMCRYNYEIPVYKKPWSHLSVRPAAEQFVPTLSVIMRSFENRYGAKIDRIKIDWRQGIVKRGDVQRFEGAHLDEVYGSPRISYIASNTGTNLYRSPFKVEGITGIEHNDNEIIEGQVADQAELMTPVRSRPFDIIEMRGKKDVHESPIMENDTFRTSLLVEIFT